MRENARIVVLQRKRRHPQRDGGNLGVQVWPRAGAVGPKDQVRPSLPVTAHRAEPYRRGPGNVADAVGPSGRAVDVVDEVDEDRGNIASIGEGQHVALTRVGTDRRIGSQPCHLQNSKPASRTLEADRADYRAVLAAVGVVAERLDDATVKIEAHREAINALGERVSGFQAEVRDRFDLINRNHEDDRAEAVAFRRSVEDGQAELKDLILQALDRRAVGKTPNRALAHQGCAQFPAYRLPGQTHSFGDMPRRASLHVGGKLGPRTRPQDFQFQP